MNKAESYCYVIRKHLKNYRARVLLYYSNQNPNPEERIEVRKTGDLNKDLQTLSKMVQNELPGKRKVKIEKENEVIKDHNQTRITAIDKYFL